MANKDTEVGVTVTSSFSEVKTDVNQATQAIDAFLKKVDEMNDDRLKKIEQFTKSMRRMNEINLAKINTNLRRTAEYVTDFVTRFQTSEMDTAVNQLDRLTYSMNGVFSVFKSIQNTKSMDVPALTALSNITFDAVDTAKLDKMMEFFNSVRSSRIDQASKSITALISSFERMGTLNFNHTMENNINSQMTKMAESLRYFMNGLDGIDVDGFVKVSKGVASVTNAMKAIEKLNATTIGEKFETISTKIRSFIVTLNEGKGVIHDFATVLTKIGGTGSKGVNTSQITKSLNQVKQDIKDTGNEADKTKRKLNNMLSFGKIYALYNQARHYGQGILNMLNQSIDFAEIENYFSRAMGNMRSEAMKFQKTLSESFGMATPAMMQAQATFKNMISALGGIDDDVAYGLSERITKMVLDYSSLYNTTIDSAITKFQAALSKQVRPIRSQSGYDITQKVLESTMEMIGINDRSIAQMGEMEKRLLIILTLQYQMARSSAMGDFARTIEQPANQLRVFQQQLSEVGRWISAVFYGTIAQVLPYINGFVMAIKELIKTFALFLGYELPDSSGDTGTILDQMGDSMGDFGAGIDNANSGLDDTKKKAKEVAKAIGNLPFDELHTISKPSNSDSGSDSGSGGAGGAMVDPRILDALNKWDYMFGNIRMKAMDIRDTILEWADKIGKVVDENIFQPIKNSWDKYGAGISANVKETFKNISHIVGGVFDVIGEKWKPLFQQASDLFFSLEETASEVLKGISRFFVYVWDNGGKTLFEGIADLATAFLKLATKINDKFVKPLIRWFNDNIVPVIGKAVGTILGLVGNLLKGLAGIIDWIADCTPLVIALASAFTGVFLAIKIAKFIELANAIEGSHKFLRLFVESLTKTSVFQNAIKMVSNLKTTYDRLNTVLKNTGVWSTLKEFIDKGVGSMKNFAERMSNSDSVLGRLAGSVVNKLGSALSWLASNPLFAVAGAIAVVVGALAVFASSQKETTYELEDCSQAVQDQVNRINELSSSMDDAKKSAEDRLTTSQAEIKMLENNIDALQRMGGESGYVDNIASAQALVEQINQKLPETVQLTEDGRLEWLKMPDAIQESIEALKEKARIEAYSQLYTEAIKAQIEAEREHAKAVDELSGKQEHLTEITARKAELEKIFYQKKNDYTWQQSDEARKYAKELTSINKELETLPADVQHLTEAVNTSEKAWEDATTSVNELGDSMSYNKDIMKNTSDALKGVSDTNREALNELGKSLSGSKKTLEDYSAGVLELDEKQVISAKTSKDKIIAKYAEQAKSMGKSYDEMIGVLMEQGIILTEEEKKQLQTSLTNLQNGMSQQEVEFQLSKQRTLETLKQHNSNMTAEEESQYALMLDNLNKKGIEVSATKYEQYQSMMKAMKEHNIEVNSEQATQYTNLLKQLSDYGIDMSNEQNLQHLARLVSSAEQGDEEGKKYLKMLQDGVASGNIDPQVWKILSDAGYIFDTNPQTVGVDVENPKSKAQTIFDDIKGIFSSPLKVTLGVGMDVSQLGTKMGNAIRDALNIPRMATGGFPDVGQLFIANEAGPELIGNLGGRTAVANHYQIEEGIAKAVARGSMGNNSSAPQVINTHITVDLDSEVVAEAVHKSESKKGFNFTKGGGKL